VFYFWKIASFFFFFETSSLQNPLKLIADLRQHVLFRLVPQNRSTLMTRNGYVYKIFRNKVKIYFNFSKN